MNASEQAYAGAPLQLPQRMTIFITGAAGGIGLEAARAFLERGDRVIASARSAARCADIEAELGDRVETLEMDMGSVASIRAGAVHLAEIAPKLDALVNNAGVLNTKREVDTDGREMTWGVNVVAPFLLSELLAPQLEAAGAARVVNVGSVAHKAGKIAWDDPEFATRKYSGWSAYSQSKLALVLLTRAFAKRHPSVAAFCVHPGGIATGIYRSTPSFLRGILARVLPGPSAGAVPIVMLATEPNVTAQSGTYFDKTNETPAAAAARDDAAADRLYRMLGERYAIA